jgi:hypothetical protein
MVFQVNDVLSVGWVDPSTPKYCPGGWVGGWGSVSLLEQKEKQMCDLEGSDWLLRLELS